MSDKIGEILIREGLIDDDQLARALDAQVIFGGRIGTNLVELEYLSIEELGRALALQHGIPSARRVDLLAVTPETLAAVPAAVCARYRVFPLALDGKRIELAMLDPSDLKALDELTFMLGPKIEPRVVPELRMLRFLEQRYGIRRDKRFTGLPIDGSGEHPAVAPGRPRETSPAPAPRDVDLEIDMDERPPTGAGQVAPGVSPAPEVEAEEGLELVYLDAVSRAAPSRDELDFELEVAEPEYVSQLGDAITALGRATSRDDVIELLVRPTISLVSVNVLFLVRGETVVGLHARGARAPSDAVKGLVLPLNTPSLLQEATSRRAVVHGATRADPLQQVVARHLGAETSEQVWVAPVCLGARVINLLCVHLCRGAVDGGEFERDLGQLCQAAAAAYARLIRGRR